MVKPEQIQVNDLLAITHYTKVERVSYNYDILTVRDVDEGKMFEIRGTDLIKSCLSADRFVETKQVKKTELAQKLSTSFNVPFTVCFTKKGGEERVLRGRLVNPEPLMGRSYCEDLNESDDRLRLVDHRNLKWLIVEGTKWELK